MRRSKWSVALVCVLLSGGYVSAKSIVVSPSGDDAGTGEADKPVRTIAAAQKLARAAIAASEPVEVVLKSGVYYLPEPIVMTSADSGRDGAPVVYRAEKEGEAILSGGALVSLEWRPYRDGIMQAAVPADFTTDQLFVNGQRQMMARFPNYDPDAQYYGGSSPDAFSPERAANWKDPTGGYIHAMHKARWGGYHYRITGKDADNNVTFEGGWQNNRQSGMHDKIRFVENIFEELDAPGEWFHDKAAGTLYYFPPKGVDIHNAQVETVRLRHLIEFQGTQAAPVRFVRLQGLTLKHAARTFMDNKEPLLRSDWTTYRGGAIFFQGAEDCAVEDAFIDQVGGNAIFVSGYNRRIAVRGNHIANAGANGVAFVGEAKSVRSPLFEYRQRQSYNTVDKTPGPKTDDYPADCVVDNSLIYRSGRVEKQTAGVQISMAMGITVSRCSIYDLPRAGINISEGTFGGHLIDQCDVFDTVLETHDHGSFNSWGRDRFWGLTDIDLGKVTLGDDKDLPILDVVKTNVIRNSRWRCEHGWDIDLDDGSTRYEIYNNVCLAGGLKNREGFFRVVENNVIANNSFHPHVWYGNSQDVFRRNIVFTPYKPIRVGKPWGKEIDYNLLHDPEAHQPRPAEVLAEMSGRDEHSLVADAKFIDAANGDFRVAEDSPALQLGFKNFPMDQFGVQKPSLKSMARTPSFGPKPEKQTERPTTRDSTVLDWRGAKVKSVVGLGEMSATGLPSEAGVLVVEMSDHSAAAQLGVQKGDVILSVDGQATDTAADLMKFDAVPAGKRSFIVWRDQQRLTLSAD